jgi:hypothetical protein
MFPEKPAKVHVRARRLRVEFEEERAWVAFYARVPHDATVAAEVLLQLEADAELKRDRLALYLCCKESVQSHKARQERNRRIGQAVRLTFRLLVVRPVLALRRSLQLSGSLAIECLPETHPETPATPAPRPRRSPALVRTPPDPAEIDRRPGASGTLTDAGAADPVVPHTKAVGNMA